MKNPRKGSTPVVLLVIILIILLVSLGWVYFKRTRTNQSVSNNSNSNVTFNISGNSLSVISDEKNIQTISLSHDAIQALGVVPGNVKKFITDLDVNFDGQNDVGVFTSTGYAGVNNYYDFYVYNSQTKKFEKNSILVEISNPVVDIGKKQIKSNYRSGPQWYTNTFQFNGATYTKSDGLN